MLGETCTLPGEQVDSGRAELSQLSEVLERQKSGGVCLGDLLQAEIVDVVLRSLLSVLVCLLQGGVLAHQLLVLSL